MFKAVVIRTDDSVSIEDLDYDKTKTIIGGWLEGIRIGEDAFAFVDEDGPMKKLPLNRIATVFARHNSHTNISGGIVGNMVICGLLNEQGIQDGDEHDVPQWVKDYFGV